MQAIDERVEELWATYFVEKSRESRNRLIENYLPLVKSVAERLHTRLPREIDVDDLISDGIFGLVDSIETFDPGRGVEFEVFSDHRIRGAMLDKLRQMDWVPRLVRLRHRRVDEASRQYEIKYGRRATDVELAEEMGVSTEEFLDLARSATAPGTISLNRTYSDVVASGDAQEIEFASPEESEDVAGQLQKDDLRNVIIRGLNRRERLLITLYYYEGMTMKEVGATLRLSESRVSQMHTSILLRLQRTLSDRRREFVA
jgi:RNA polymerase sigma factor FliA